MVLPSVGIGQPENGLGANLASRNTATFAAGILIDNVHAVRARHRAVNGATKWTNED